MLANRVFMFFGAFFVWCNPFWRIHLYGLEKVDKKDRGVVFIGNHQSFLDMPLFATLPWKMKWVSKKELFKIPVAGWIMTMCGHVSIDRGKKTAINSMYGIAEYANNNVSVMVYPEGSRSRDGNLKPFKNGTFIISKEYNFPVQPVVVYGTHQMMKPDAWKISRISGNIFVSVLDRINPADFDTMESMRDHAQKVIQDEINRLAEEKEL